MKVTFEDSLETTVGQGISFQIVWRQIWITLTRQSEPSLNFVRIVKVRYKKEYSLGAL